MKLDGLGIDELVVLPKNIDVSAVICFCFNDQKELLVVKNKRGWDVPGGHVEAGETPEEALVREVMEEACATIIFPVVFLSATSTRSMVFYVAKLDVLHPFNPEYETTDRAFMTPADFIHMYQGGMPELVAHALTSALELI